MICAYRGDESSCGQTDVIRLCETWFDGQKKINDSSSDLVADIILGLSAQPAEREDAVVVEDLLGKQRESYNIPMTRHLILILRNTHSKSYAIID